MKRIFVVNSGRYMKVDDKNYFKVAYHNVKDSGGALQIKINGKQIGIGSYILGVPGIVDHIDRNPYNCLEKNLRPSTRSENNCNRSLQSNSTSGATGVSYYKSRDKWEAYIEKDGIRYKLGYFSTREEAIEARNKAALKYHKKFAVLNKIED